MKQNTFIENSLMYTGLALLCASVAYFFLLDTTLRAMASTLSHDQQVMEQMSLLKITLLLFVSGAGLALTGFGITAINAWRAFNKPSEVRK
jgi:hypothetical protein